MSWFARKPVKKQALELSKRRYSPATDRLLKETKQSTKPTENNKAKK